MKIKTIGSDYLIFDDGSMLASEHLRECCESHWLD